MSSNLEKVQEGGSEEWGAGSGDETHRESDIDKEAEGHQSPKDIEKEETEEIKWPCSMCGVSVSEDGLECVGPAGCNMWCHADCADVIYPRECNSKPFKCPKCSEKPVSKASKAKDRKIRKGKLGRPPKNKDRNLSITIKNLSISSSQAKDQIVKKASSKRNIEEVGSPEKTGKNLGASPIKSPNSKKPREEIEEIDKTDKTDGEKKDTEEVTHTSPLVQRVWNYFTGGKVETQEGKEKEEKENEGIGRENEGKKQELKTTGGEEKIHEGKEKEGIGRKNEGKKQELKTTKGENKAREEVVREGSNSTIEYKGIKINKEDLKSMEGKNWITITVLDAFMAKLEDTRREELKNNKILLIQPNITQIFQYGDRKCAHHYKKLLKTKEYDWIFYPVSNTSYPENGILDGGFHWSLMVFSKTKHAFLHLDSIRGMNEMGAKKMVVNMGDEEDFNDKGQWPAFYQADCSRQDNSWACGAYLMHFMDRVIKEIGEGRGNDIGNMRALQCEVVRTRDKFRETLEELVQKEKEMEITYEKVQNGKGGGGNKQYTERTERKISKQDENEKIEVDPPVTVIEKIPESDRRKNTVDRSIADLNKDRVNKGGRNTTECKFYLKGDCWRGESCRFEHRKICEGWKVNGACGNSKCKYAHIEKCKQFYKGNCQRLNCRYHHPTGIVVVNIQNGNQKGALDQDQQLWRNPGRTQERNLMQNQNRNFLGNQIGVPYQNQQMRQNQGMEQESQWRRNQSQNIWQREHMVGNPHQNQQIRQNLGMEQGNQWNQNSWQQEQMVGNYGYPVPTEILIRAGWEKIMNQGGMWWT